MPDTTYLDVTTPLAGTIYAMSLTAQEQISRPFSYALEMISPDDSQKAITVDDLIDKPVTVTVGDPAAHGRYFNGIVQTIKQLPSANGEMWRYRLTLVPKLWFLGQTQASRIYQNLSVPDIVSAVLNKFGVTFSQNLQGSYTVREYTVQYNESYLHFIQRLLEDEGIFYFFTHTDAAHTMVIADSKSAFSEINNPSLTVREGSQNNFDLASWHREDSTVLGDVKFEDYNHAATALAPGTTVGESKTVLTNPGAAQRTYYSWPAVRGTASDVTAKSKWRIEAAEAGAQLYAGTSGAPDFIAGGKITVVNDPTNGGESSDYVLRAVSYHITDHTGVNADAAPPQTSMSCIAFPAKTPWRETPVFAPPMMAGIYSAKVVGPDGQDIYHDDLGRIKVQFAWNELTGTEAANAIWVRVLQPWGGAGWGVQFIPRVGMEVAILFLEGDVNRPVAMGSFYNSINTPLFPASSNNKSGIRTRSMLQGGTENYHEISFDDTKGSELMLLHAEKDYNLSVENDQTVTVDHDRMVTVTNDETVKIDGNQTITIKKDRALTVTDGDMSTEVSKGDHSIKIDTGDHSLEVATGDHTIKVNTGDYSTKVATGDHATEVSTGDFSTKVSMGDHSTEVSMGNHTTKVSMGDLSTKVELGSVTIEAMQSITLKVGGNSVVISATGVTIKGLMVQVSGPMVEVSGDGMLTLKGGITMIN